MDLILQPSLEHQQRGVDAVANAFSNVRIDLPSIFYPNPSVSVTKDVIDQNVLDIQNSNQISPEYKGYKFDPGCLNIDIKMETGTGKTYVYTKTMYELHKRYGINKFIVFVPSLPIKSGTKQFIEDEYTVRHFRDVCGYDSEIELLTLEAPKKKKKGRQYFPTCVSEFLRGSMQDKKKIYVLLVNMQLLTGSNMLYKDDYDSGIEGFYRPIDAIKATRPFVIIDEPHRFSRDQQAYSKIKEDIAPQCIIRYGATFPEIASGRGRNRIVRKDYLNLLYDLNACQSFNKGLIKGVAKEHFEPTSHKQEKIKLVSTVRNDSATFQYKSENNPIRTFILRVNDSLAVISEELTGIFISSIASNKIELSTGQEKTVGEEMEVDIFMQSYQEQMLRLALDRHFETERENFTGRNFKIKTLALFFIDDITSFRETDGKDSYLIETFDRLLKEKIIRTIGELSPEEKEYEKFLQASLNNIEACRGGYFAQDNSSSDEAIAQEVDDILKGKKKLLQFKDSDGNYILRRFLFSKWTLKEGWDNPNVFTITKLRSSGSENSKLQEVGRGLRLPVDECGNRISNQEFWLNYIVDFEERNFAEDLTREINEDGYEIAIISQEMLEAMAKKAEKDVNSLMIELLQKHYIDFNRNIILENRQKLFEEYPFLQSGLKKGKVRDRNQAPDVQIGIRKAKFEELRDLWEVLNRRYTIKYERSIDSEIESALYDILENKNVFTQNTISSSRDRVVGTGNGVETQNSAGVQYIINSALPYGLFLKRLSQHTNIPVKTIHAALSLYVDRHGMIEAKFINRQSLRLIEREFYNWKVKTLQKRMNYQRTNYSSRETALTYANGTIKQTIAQGRIGRRIEEGEPMAKYLYDAKAYDSPLELQNIEAQIDEVIVYGKIPRNSIAIPTILGSYSPDFMYVVKKSTGEKELNIVVETKDVTTMSDLREEETIKIKCAEIFFKNLEEEGYNVKFKSQLKNDTMLQLIKDMIE